MANPSDITARIITLGTTISGVITADDELPASLTDAQLPFLLVVDSGANYSAEDSETIRITRDFTLYLWVKAFEQGSLTSEKTARDACQPFLASVPKFFWGRRQLQTTTDTGVTSVRLSALVRDEGAQAMTHNQRYFYGVPFRLSVTYTDVL